MTLFRQGDFTLHSGSKSWLKIDCDALTDDDWATLAIAVYEHGIKFRRVIGVPQGGLKFAYALEPYRFPNPEYPVLIVDDVMTTGNSMEEMRAKYPGSIGVVVWARGRCPDWIEPINRYWED